MSIVAFPKAPAAPKAEPTTHLGMTECNKLLRRQLAAAFPGIKFSIRGSRYSGGSSTNIDWIDGPTQEQVEAISKAYSGRGFDGMIDMSYSKTSWQMPDGSIVTGWSEGTEGSMGAAPGYVVPKPHPQARAVSTGISYVFAKRQTSAAFRAACLAAFERMNDADRSRISCRAPAWAWDDESSRGRWLAALIPAPKA